MIIKIKNFIRAIDGTWHNINFIRSFYIGGSDERGFRICFTFETNEKNSKFIWDHTSIGSTHKKELECQKELDEFLGKYDHF